MSSNTLNIHDFISDYYSVYVYYFFKLYLDTDYFITELSIDFLCILDSFIFTLECILSFYIPLF